eukprot:7783-Chlamydomonas_euryale.AAC.2
MGGWGAAEDMATEYTKGAADAPTAHAMHAMDSDTNAMDSDVDAMESDRRNGQQYGSNGVRNGCNAERYGGRKCHFLLFSMFRLLNHSHAAECAASLSPCLPHSYAAECAVSLSPCLPHTLWVPGGPLTVSEWQLQEQATNLFAYHIAWAASRGGCNRKKRCGCVLCALVRRF